MTTLSIIIPLIFLAGASGLSMLIKGLETLGRIQLKKEFKKSPTLSLFSPSFKSFIQKIVGIISLPS